MPAAGVWGLILAGGEGARLRALTTSPCGAIAPKQFCSLYGGQTLLEDAMDRAAALAPAERLCTVVADQHRRWWAGLERLERFAPGNVIVQPRNCGTAIGVLYAMLHLLTRDPHARVLMVPADHFVRDEAVLREALRTALTHVEADPRRPVLIGVEPDETDSELGYILAGARDRWGGHAVARFVEKPDAAEALELIASGGLWNTFIIAASAQSLVDLFLPRFAAMVMEMQILVSRAVSSGSPTAGWPAIVDMYGRMPHLDFSRDVLQGREARLCVLRSPRCGWSDLGTPRRVGETLRRMRLSELDIRATPAGCLNLAVQHAKYASRIRTSPPRSAASPAA